jgi:hypothetical protein
MNVVLSYGLGVDSTAPGPLRDPRSGGGAFPIFARLPPCGEGGDRLALRPGPTTKGDHHGPTTKRAIRQGRGRRRHP